MEQHIEPVISQAAHWTDYGLLGLVLLQMFAMLWFLLRQLVASKKTKDPLTKEEIKEIVVTVISESGLSQMIKNGTELLAIHESRKCGSIVGTSMNGSKNSPMSLRPWPIHAKAEMSLCFKPSKNSNG